jgi:sterol desaturase/sphingolipid hydroxylase (fatty acid hydroxylase superfamily)
MHELIHYFTTIPPAHRALILAAGIAIFWLIEEVVPFKKYNYHKWKHAGINIFFTVTTIVVNFCLALILLKSANWSQVHHFGILNLLPSLPPWLFAIIGLLLLDFIGAYLVHYVEHKIPFLWRFHLIHHTDATIDTTSANRHHPGESVLRFVFTALGVLIVGSPMWLVFLYQTLSVVATQFNHANIVLPSKLDTLLGYFIVSPDMHKVHHHYMMPYTDSNYGNIFSVWDRLFGTYKTLDRDQLVYGIDTHMLPEEHDRLKNLLAIPFQKKRSHQAFNEKK